jgi:hypothetical protein
LASFSQPSSQPFFGQRDQQTTATDGVHSKHGGFPMKTIPLSQGQVALVDDADFELLNDFKWSYRPERNGAQDYAVRHKKVNGKDRLAYLHREILPAPEGHEVIFLNHDRLDCRRENLKIVSKEEARQHHRVRRDSKSGIKGVRYNADTDTWSAFVYRSGRCFHVGTYYSPEQASAAYVQALREENPGLAMAPARVERPGNPASTQRTCSNAV